jgi:hypothetical protein
MMQMVMVAITAFMLFINLPVQVQGAGETDHPDVVDAEGNPVLVGAEYYVLPAVDGSGGGLTLKMRVNNSCPLYVAQEDSEKSRGLPVVFRPAKGQTGNYSSVIVQEHVNLNVNMAAVTTCVQSTAWSVQNDANTTKRFIKASDSSSLFQIVKAIDGDGYVLYFCPCNCRLVCTKVGIYVDGDEKRWLVIDNSAEALRVQFQKNE